MLVDRMPPCNNAQLAMMGMYAIPEPINANVYAVIANTTGTQLRTNRVIQCHDGWLVAL